MLVRDVKSCWSDVKRVVPQGSILGLLFFVLYVNHLPYSIQQRRVKQYADDTTLSGDVLDLEKLKNDAERVAKWVEANKLRLNVMKTNLLLMSRKRRAQELQQVKLKVNNQELITSNRVKCLGVGGA